MKDENVLILELCKFLNPDGSKIEDLLARPLAFPYVLGQLCWHRMGGAAYYILRECGLLGKVNREFRNTLKTVYDSGKAKSESLKTALAQIAGIEHNTEFPLPYDAKGSASFPFMYEYGRPAFAGKASFPYALLKGAYLVSLYPEGLRTSNDIDILVNESDLSVVEKLLKLSGFLQGNIRNGIFAPASRAEIVSSRMNRGETVPFIKEIGLPGMTYLEIDINFSLDFKAKQENDAVAALLGCTQPLIETGNGNLFTLCPADFLLHLCCHLYKEAATYAWVEMERDLSLYKFADLYLLLHKWTDAGIYDTLAARAVEYSQQKAVYYSMLRTKELFGLENAALDKLLANLKPEDASFINEIFKPDENKTYRHDENYIDWLFMSGRKERLHEVQT